MPHHYHIPRESLRECIRTLLVADKVAGMAELPMIPQGTATLLCILEEEKQEIWLFGKTVDMTVFEGKKNFSLLAAFFKPFVAAPLFGIAAKNLVQASFPAEEWDRKRSTLLKEKMAQSVSMEEGLSLFQSLLEELLEKNRNTCQTVLSATDWLVTNPAGTPFVDLLEELQVTERTLQRVFNKYVGMPPNQFRRICQFHSAFVQLRSDEFELLSDIAYEQGYADQSHFTRTFKEFTDRSPNEYLKHGLNSKK